MLLLYALAFQAAAAPPPDPLAALHGIVVDNIRHCPAPAPGEIAVCSRDRGFAEGYRLPKKDPRFEGKSGLLADGTITLGAPAPNSCTDAGMVGKTSCTIDDYQRWRAWQRAQAARSVTIER